MACRTATAFLIASGVATISVMGSAAIVPPLLIIGFGIISIFAALFALPLFLLARYVRWECWATAGIGGGLAGLLGSAVVLQPQSVAAQIASAPFDIVVDGGAAAVRLDSQLASICGAGSGRSPGGTVVLACLFRGLSDLRADRQRLFSTLALIILLPRRYRRVVVRSESDTRS